MPTIRDYGRFEDGMTISEIKEYLKVINNVTVLGQLFNKFCRAAKVKPAEFKDELTVMPYDDIEDVIAKMK